MAKNTFMPAQNTRNVELDEREYSEFKELVNFALSQIHPKAFALSHREKFKIIGSLLDLTGGSVSNNLYKIDNPSPSLSERSFNFFCKILKNIFHDIPLQQRNSFAWEGTLFDNWKNTLEKRLKANLLSVRSIELEYNATSKVSIGLQQNKFKDIFCNTSWYLYHWELTGISKKLIVFDKTSDPAIFKCRILEAYDLPTQGKAFYVSPNCLVVIADSIREDQSYFHLAITFQNSKNKVTLCGAQLTRMQDGYLNTDNAFLLFADRKTSHPIQPRELLEKSTPCQIEDYFKFSRPSLPSLYNPILKASKREIYSLDGLEKYNAYLNELKQNPSMLDIFHD